MAKIEFYDRDWFVKKKEADKMSIIHVTKTKIAIFNHLAFCMKF